MKRTKHKIIIIGLTLLFLSLSTSGQSDTYYRCVNSKGSVMITNTGPTDPDYKCTPAASYRDPSPQERSQEQREIQRRGEKQKLPILQPSPNTSKISGSGAGKYKVTIKRIDFNLYQDIFSGIIIKTIACIELALMEEAILDWNGGSGELFFKNSRTSCMVVEVHK